MDWRYNSDQNRNCGAFWWNTGSNFWSWAGRRSELLFFVIDTMGGLCSRRSTVDNASSGSFPNVNGHGDHKSGVYQSPGLSSNMGTDLTPPPGRENMDKQLREPFSFPDMKTAYGSNEEVYDGIPRFSRTLSHKSISTKSKQMAVTKVSEVSSLLGRAGTAGLGKAVEVLDTLGSSMTNLNNSGFVSGVTTKGNKISILAFEVANTIVKGANLMQSLSEENIKHLKEVVLPSEGVQHLVSKDMDQLLRIAAADKREELKVFSGEVVRFGNRCKDPQWHNLDRYFEKLGTELIPQRQLKKEAPGVVQQLMTLVQYTAELYHELHALDRFQQDYRRKLQEEDNSSIAQRDGDKPVKGSNNNQRLGSAGLALHYANIITQIDTLVSRSSSVPPNTRDSLYQGLPPSIKSALRSKLLSFQLKEELTVPQIKAEMEKTLQWLVPIATNTTKAHHGFGWVGEWANTGSEVNRKPTGQSDLLRIETLHHADKEKTDAYILELVVWLNHLISQSRSGINGGLRSPIKSPIRSPTQKTVLSMHKPSSPSSMLTVEDQEMLRDVNKRKLTPGISKSQEFDRVKTRLRHNKLTKSNSHSPTSGNKTEFVPVRRPSVAVPVIDFDIDRIKALDVIDRVDTLKSL
ncbi:PREDICTED: uncharacterized protein LOC104608266 isoform X3 [Nelumbo nucifera]|uniref:Uncharacterized protein LOC104608266 isoform X3 n=1 Tax=Nelumbo nucifera TaxID=4432 RepID=A0A1U8B902_NELNU|nr:PREDICTED: uncharacterized protein LOC104608266 isoform X3 [Nelumbo nucifera]